MEVSSSLRLGFGEWSMGGVRITQLEPPARFVGRVSINETAFISRLIIFPTNYGDSGVYQFSDVEANLPVPMVEFYISLPPRSVESELSTEAGGTAHVCLLVIHSTVWRCSASWRYVVHVCSYYLSMYSDHTYYVIDDVDSVCVKSWDTWMCAIKRNPP